MLLSTIGLPGLTTTLTLDYKFLERRAGTSTNGTAKIQLQGNEVFGQFNRQKTRAFWSYDGQFSHGYLQGAQANSRVGFNCFQIVPSVTFATNEYGPTYVLGREKYREFLKGIDAQGLPKSVVAQLKNPGKFNATLPMGKGFCAPAMIKSQGAESSRTINMRVGTEAHPSCQFVYSRFKKVGKHWVPSRIDMKYFEQVDIKKLGSVTSTVKFELIGGSETGVQTLPTIEDFFAPDTAVSFSAEHGKPKTITYTKTLGTLKARLQAALAMQ